MLKKKSSILISIFFLFISCKKVDVKNSDIFNSLALSPKTAVGDGSQIISIVCEVNPKADGAQDFVLSTSMGVFVENKEMKILKKPEFKGGKYVIETKAQVPLADGKMIISVEPNLPLEKTDYIISEKVILDKSNPASIQLSSSSLGLGRNFNSDVQLTGILYNSSNKKVAAGTKVKFIKDNLGRFSEEIVSSNSDSRVSTSFGAGDLLIGTEIKITAIILNESNNPTNMTSSVILTVNNL